MKTIEIDDDLYQYIAGQTLRIGESASDILRRLLPSAPVKTAANAAESSGAGVAVDVNLQADINERDKSGIELPPSLERVAPSPVAEAVVDNSSNVAQTKVADRKVGNVFDLVTPQDLQAESNIVGRFLYLLSVLARVHKKQFHKVLDIKGRNRLYFGNSAAELAETGTSTNPKQIPNTTFWVITNSNTTRKKMMLTETALKLGYSAEEAERIRDLL